MSSADRANRKSVGEIKRATSTTDVYEGQLVPLFLSPRLWLLPVCRVINGTRNLEKAMPLRQPIVSRREGATGVIGHNLVDSLIYKQSLMKFLVFINNALQPRAPVCRHRYPGIPRCFSPLPPALHPFYTLPFSCSYSGAAASARTIVRHPLSPWLSTNPYPSPECSG